MRKVTALMVAVLVAGAGTATAQQNQILYISGHSWETGGFPPSVVGDSLSMVGILNDIGNPLTWDTQNYSYTWWARDLVSLGEVLVGSTRVVDYTGGFFTVYVDSLPSNHDYGINPPNGTSPSTFNDGFSTYLDGYYTYFQLTFDDTQQSGTLYGTLNFTGGDVYGQLNSTDGYTFGANLAGVSPQGYDLEINAQVYLEVVSVQPESWGGIKSLYR